ncbi:MAG: hypothetical protein JO020_09105 [Chloroflexi bacterium]|nr:hypothetical protein [Chloroflexota bacterium]MBV9135159.1 hypothetical protein [Chloroflexota bacterium]MBV9894315.1 hypothetical protein [Chloroflexota bacterium]
MPRVNRDLQRRLAARRERDRRRPSGERRYRFTTPDPALEGDEEALLQEDGAVADAVEDKAPPRSTRTAPAAGNRAAQRPAAKPFSAYKDEYAYVYGDLRRVGAVIGGLLLALIILYFVLPLLVR